MSEITALNMASTDELVAALAIRYRVRLAEACSGIEDMQTMAMVMQSTINGFVAPWIEVFTAAGLAHVYEQFPELRPAVGSQE